MKEFKGKAISNPSGAAGEYSYWGANFFNGCSNDCHYCYLKRYPMQQYWSTTPYIKKGLGGNPETAIDIFKKELTKHISQLKRHGLFFSFGTDPAIKATWSLTKQAIDICVESEIHVKVLTKTVDYITELLNEPEKYNKWVELGHTITFDDGKEPNASSNILRVANMKKFHDAGFKTFASVEPIIQIPYSLHGIKQIVEFCDHLKIGIESNRRYNKTQLTEFFHIVNNIVKKQPSKTTVYWKDSLLNMIDISRSELPQFCVERDYKTFK